MKVFQSTYDGIGYGRPFDESYQKWIKEEIKTRVCARIKIIFKEKSFIIDATDSTPLQLISAAQFIGYAFGMQANGR